MHMLPIETAWRSTDSVISILEYTLGCIGDVDTCGRWTLGSYKA